MTQKDIDRNILRGISLRENTSGRVLLNIAYADGYDYLEYLRKCDDIDRVSIAGSLRRMKETIGDLDMLASSDSPESVMKFFVGYPNVQRVLLKGNTKTSVLLNDNIQVDLRVVKKESFGAALQYFTGSKEHNVKMRSIAIKKGFKLNEYGLFDKVSDEFVVGENEEEVYNKLGLEYIEPELRENRGEVESTIEGKLPSIVGYDEVRGDFHVHSSWSDGSDTLEAIAEYTHNMGYEFVGITDHSQSLKIARGLSGERVDKKNIEINKINNKYSDFKVFCGTECDIKPDGSLDYSNTILKKFDFVYIGIHTSFKMNEEDMTQRIIRGMENEYVDFVAHPTGRIIGRRAPFEVDIEQIIDAARDTETFLELNSFPDRLDLNDIHSKFAKEKGVRFVLGTDAHNVNQLSFIRFGIATARRGWLEKKDILNTYSLKEVEKYFGM